jgi:mannose/fructose/N-acetylgalactosamine-specific phosphotransferase system component IIC
MVEMIAAGALYAALALDHIAVGQFMVSRPLVVGPLLGLYFGDPVLGLLAGAAAELLWVHVIPVGLWPIDSTVVAALAVSWTLSSQQPGRATLVLALALAIPCGVFARHADIWFRRQNARFLPWIGARLAAGDEGVLARAVALSLALWFLKAWALFCALGVAGAWAVDALAALCPPRIMLSLDFAGRVLPLLGFAVVLNYFVERIWVKSPWTHDPSPNP